jgi:hypothetical protein
MSDAITLHHTNFGVVIRRSSSTWVPELVLSAGPETIEIVQSLNTQQDRRIYNTFVLLNHMIGIIIAK